MTQVSFKPTTIGSISHGTHRTEDLLSAFISELEWQVQRNGDYFSQPENHAARDRLNNLIGEAQDCFADDGDGIAPEKEDVAQSLISEDLLDVLGDFAPAYFYFGSHPGDGADFGFWLSENWREDAEDNGTPIVDDAGALPDDFESGEWFHVSDHGNLTLYARDEQGHDSEVWAVV